MIQFYFCSLALERLTEMQSNYKEAIYKKIYEYQSRNDLKNIKNIDSSGNNIYILRLHHPESRIIIEEKELTLTTNEIIKVFFIRDIIHDIKFDREYGRLLYGKIKRGEWIKENLLSEEDTNRFLSSLQSKKNHTDQQSTYLNSPPQELINWLDDFKLTFNNTIFESEKWVTYAHDNTANRGMCDTYLSLFRLLILKIIQLPLENFDVIETTGTPILRYEDQELNCGILFSQVRINNKKYFLLHNGAHLSSQQNYWKECISEISKDTLPNIHDYETLSRLSFRSYPQWTLSKDEIWFRIEKSEDSNNLSLTNEQIRFLSEFKFPSYINGQAGSGKSTLLYYIFATIIYYKELAEINGEILFLTENEQLLTDTRENIFNLLENNPEFYLPVDTLTKYRHYFISFKNFLLNFLSEDDLQQFKEDKYLNFSSFKMKYESSNIQNHIKNDYSAEEAWFVITTYIYGHEINTKLKSNDYESMVWKKSQKISPMRFNIIEQYILPFYESLLEDGYWDKLKIIRYISKNVNLDLKKKYSVIICDEAQDFCRVELNYILQQSEYLHYDLSHIKQVPIIFAGDASQTVNPTGFRDAEITTLIYQELQAVSNFKYDKETTTYKPNINYRSKAPIVTLANFVQFYRKNNFDVEQKCPQEAKLHTQHIPNDQCFNTFIDYQAIVGNQKLKENLVQKLQYKIFIIPTDTEENNLYPQTVDFLSNLPDIEIKTSLEAKGAEYQHVVLCGFGEYFLSKFKSFENTDKSFEKSYYFNKLYVAITRAQAELIIIDSPIAKDQFWKKLIQNIEVQNQNGWDKLQEFKDTIIAYNTDSIHHILESTKQDALANAKEDKKLGEFYSNPSRLKVAASQFYRLGQQDQANYCYGLAAEITNNYKLAGEYYQKANKLDLASNVFFKGRYFDDLEKLGQNLHNVEHALRLIITRIIKNEHVSQDDFSHLLKNKKEMFKIIKLLEWREEFIKACIVLLQKLQDYETTINFLEILNEISTTDDKLLIKEIANTHFKLGNYQEAYMAWEKIDNFDNVLYYEAKLKYYEKQGNHENIVIFSNELIKYKQTFDEKLPIYKKIVALHKNNNFINFGNEYYLVVLQAKIFAEEKEEILLFHDLTKKKVYSSELELFYATILEKSLVSKDIFAYLVLQWAELIATNLDDFGISRLKDINKIYEEQSKKYNIPYKPYSLEELQERLAENQTPDFLPNEHLSNITINNFRQFESVSLKNMGLFNLIVGDNNIGKTSLLESLLFTNDYELYYKNLAFAYISRNNIPYTKEHNEIQYDLPKDFLYDFFKIDATRKEIIFVLQEERNQWTYKLREPSEQEILNSLGTIQDEKEFICISSDKKVTIQNIRKIINNIDINDISKVQFIPFGRGFDRSIVRSYYDNFEKDKRKRNEFLDYMKIFIPEITRILVDTDKGIISIEESARDSDIPLHHYGEGANKLFRVLVQIMLQKNKKLLIDEIDAGIHYSHFIEFWKVILKVAKENNVQIFASTHNLECIQYFKQILEEIPDYQSLSRIITLRRLQDSTIKSYTRQFQEFDYDLTNEFEIRGGVL